MKCIYISLISIVVCSISGSASQLAWNGSEKPVISVAVPSATGLEEVCVADGLIGLSVSFPATSASEVKWFRYSNLGGGYAEEITTGISFANGKSVLNKIDGDMGYIVETAGCQYCFWVVDYSRHRFSVTSISESAEKDCSFLTLDVNGNGEEIVYYGINGRRFTLDRDLKLSYRTLTEDFENITFVESQCEDTYPSFSRTLSVVAPLCSTDFTLSGDRFLREWGEEVSATSNEILPYAVKSITSAVQTERDADNEVEFGSGGAAFGGSAPCEVNFEAAVTDGAVFKEWQFSRQEDFEDISLRFQELNIRYSFTEEGLTYVRFVCANADGMCESYSDVFTISIGTSSLKCPNAFSPNGDGINDEWKVSYSSIVDFECYIFDRYGHKLATLTDPSQGWDGKRNGKVVPTGAYYYVIKARGADGKSYDCSGDINIVSYNSSARQ